MLGNEKLWSCTPNDSGPLPDGVQVWAAWLDVTGDEAAEFWSTLSSQERERANRFARERSRACFVAARGLLRAILGSSLGAEPKSLEFAYGAKGKPSLGGAFAGSRLEFNLSHSDGLGVFAVARHCQVGVDVEQVRPVPDLSAISQRFFSPRECAEIKRHSEEEAASVFFKIWTRKEAWLKVTGEGITGLSSTIEVIGPPGEANSCSRRKDGPSGMRSGLFELTPAPGFVGALAVTP